MKVKIERNACDYVRNLPEKSRRIILSHLRKLEEPLQIQGIEQLATDVYRMHVGRTYTILFTTLLDCDVVRVTDIYPIGTAHKRYNKIYLNEILDCNEVCSVI